MLTTPAMLIILIAVCCCRCCRFQAKFTFFPFRLLVLFYAFFFPPSFLATWLWCILSAATDVSLRIIYTFGCCWSLWNSFQNSTRIEKAYVQVQCFYRDEKIWNFIFLCIFGLFCCRSGKKREKIVFILFWRRLNGNMQNMMWMMMKNYGAYVCMRLNWKLCLG